MRGELLTGLLGLALLGTAAAAELELAAVSEGGNLPVADAVVHLAPLSGLPPVSPATAVMDQRDQEFVPHVLAVRKGTLVRFPNSDDIRHHVYSFSPAKTFELRLYSGTQAEPVLFEKPGPVVLGCNIHDWMLGYIYVVDTPWFAKTDKDGQARIGNIPPGRYVLHVWHPRLLESKDTRQRELSLADGEVLRLRATLKLGEPVKRPRDERPSRLENRLRRTIGG